MTTFNTLEDLLEFISLIPEDSFCKGKYRIRDQFCALGHIAAYVAPESVKCSWSKGTYLFVLGQRVKWPKELPLNKDGLPADIVYINDIRDRSSKKAVMEYLEGLIQLRDASVALENKSPGKKEEIREKESVMT